MRPPKERLFAVAKLIQTNISAEAADLVDEALTACNDSPVEAVGWLLARYPDDAPFVASIAQRSTVMLALQVLFAFAPNTEQALKAMEAASGKTIH